MVKWSGKVAVNETRAIPLEACNGLVEVGTYEFGADGKLIPADTFTGVRAGDDGVLYYYVNGSVGSRIYLNELVEIDGTIYLVKWSGKVAVNETRVINAENSNGLLIDGSYYFGADGKLQVQ